MLQDQELPEFVEGTVIRAGGGWYEVDAPWQGDPHGLRLNCQRRGLLTKGKQKVSQPVVVGDKVRVRTLSTYGPNAHGERLREGNILAVLPRRSELVRARYGKTDQTTVANLDQVIIVSSVRMPDFNAHRLDRFLVLAESNGLQPIICLNKIDLVDKSTFEAEILPIQKQYQALGYQCLATSVEENIGVDELRDLMHDKISALVGSSGTGKSSLACEIQPGLELWIGEVMEIGKGRHTTTEITLHPIDGGGYIADTPGVKTILLLREHEEGLDECFPEFRPYLGNCRFHNCIHTQEPGCAVQQAVKTGDITAARYESYSRILEEFKDRPVRY